MLVISAFAKSIFPMADEEGHINWYAPDSPAILAA
jgi:leucyl/phenylalanyl-tRNA---protein transferase